MFNEPLNPFIAYIVDYSGYAVVSVQFSINN